MLSLLESVDGVCDVRLPGNAIPDVVEMFELMCAAGQVVVVEQVVLVVVLVEHVVAEVMLLVVAAGNVGEVWVVTELVNVCDALVEAISGLVKEV